MSHPLLDLPSLLAGPVGSQSIGSIPDPNIRVLVVDPHPVVRAGLWALLGTQPDMYILGEVGDAPAALRLAAELQPDVVVTEASLPGPDGAGVVARLREAWPDGKVLVLTGRGDRGTARRLLEADASGYVLKSAAAAELARAVRTVAAGGAYIEPTLADEVVSGALGAPAGGATPETDLSAREAEVFRLIALGYSNKEIAARRKLTVTAGWPHGVRPAVRRMAPRVGPDGRVAEQRELRVVNDAEGNVRGSQPFAERGHRERAGTDQVVGDRVRARTTAGAPRNPRSWRGRFLRANDPFAVAWVK